MTHSQLYFVSEEIQTQAPLRSRISPVTQNARSINANHIRGGANPLPSNMEARGAAFSGKRNIAPYSNVFARSSLNISTSRNIPSQCIVSAPRNMYTDTVVKSSFGKPPEIRSYMPANVMNSNCVTSAAAIVPNGTSYEIPPTQSRVRCTTTIRKLTIKINNLFKGKPIFEGRPNPLRSNIGELISDGSVTTDWCLKARQAAEIAHQGPSR
jgi:hypothetical protein